MYLYIHYLFCGCLKFCLYGIYSCRDSSEVEAEQKLLEEVVIFFIFLFFPSPLCQIICMNSANKDWFCVLKVNGFGDFVVGH